VDWIVSEEDRADIASALDGDDVAYGRLIERYEAGVFAQMGRFTRDRGVVEELVQEVFVQVYYSLPKFRGEAPLVHWIRKIATRTGYRYWTRLRGERMRDEVLAQWARSLPPPESQSAAQAAETLQLLLALLGPKDRLVLTLYYLEDCSSQEIADRMGWNATLVRVRVHRALAALRKHLARYPELGGGHV
jgi:RNA polymerase sigma-70 factor (ECF subfamily)